jgi:hypothetical protein
MKPMASIINSEAKKNLPNQSRLLTFRGKDFKQTEITAIFKHILKFDVLFDEHGAMVTRDPLTGEFAVITFDDMLKIVWADRKRIGVKHLTSFELSLALELVTVFARKTSAQKTAYNAANGVPVVISDLEKMEIV